MTTTRIVKRIGMWTSIGLVTAVVIVVAGLFIFSGSIVGPAPAPLQLPQLSTATQSVSTASPDGTWRAGDGSVAGFRVPEAFLVQSGTIVGRTSAMTGSLVISNHEISSGSFPVDLSKLTIGGKPNASFFQLLETSKYPDATLTLAKPIVFTSIPTNGQTISSTATVSLAMHGITHAVTFPIHKGVMCTVYGILTFIKRLTSIWLQSLHHRFVAWTKPDTTSLLLGTLTDLTRNKSKLVAENVLLRQQLIILRRQVKRPACTKTDRMFTVLLVQAVRTRKQALFIVREDDAFPLASSVNGFQCSAAVAVWLLYKDENKNVSSPL